MNAKKTNPPFLNGVPEMLILQLLDERPMYGYELVQAIRAASGNRLEFGEGCIYPILHRLEAQALLASRRQAVAGRDRVVYRMTPRGRKQLAATVLDWQRVVAAVNGCLQGGERVRASLA
ncbi:MAG TPA: helix-turn-helix transcriptional regulator [Pirellulales bacterium]|nr:helix-turn-helix transcriptional regulator [Pirellulales bacterium]